MAKKYKAIPVAMNENLVVIWSMRQQSPEIQAILEEKTERQVLIYLGLQHAFLDRIEEIYIGFHRRDMTFCGRLAHGFEPGLDLYQPKQEVSEEYFLQYLNIVTALDLSLQKRVFDTPSNLSRIVYEGTPEIPKNEVVFQEKYDRLPGGKQEAPIRRLSGDLEKIVGDVVLPPLHDDFDNEDLLPSVEEVQQTLSRDLAPKEKVETALKYTQNLVRADFFFVQKEYASAKELCLKCFRENPSDANVQLLLGKVAMEEGDWKLARDYHEQSIDLHPSLFEALANLALIYERLKKKQLALSMWLRAIQFSPSEEATAQLKKNIRLKYPNTQVSSF